jgi:hypothetical protein
MVEITGKYTTIELPISIASQYYYELRRQDKKIIITPSYFADLYRASAEKKTKK